MGVPLFLKGRLKIMYKSQIIKHVTKEMQLMDGNKIVFSAIVDVAVDDYLQNVPALQKSITDVMEKQGQLQEKLAGMDNTQAMEALKTLADFSKDLNQYINVFLNTVLGVEKARELITVCNGRYLDAYASILPFVNECIAPAIKEEMEKNVARIEDIMK